MNRSNMTYRTHEHLEPLHIMSLIQSLVCYSAHSKQSLSPWSIWGSRGWPCIQTSSRYHYRETLKLLIIIMEMKIIPEYSCKKGVSQWERCFLTRKEKWKWAMDSLRWLVSTATTFLKIECNITTVPSVWPEWFPKGGRSIRESDSLIQTMGPLT